MRPDLARDAQRHPRAGEPARTAGQRHPSLLDMQLDVFADARQPGRVCSRGGRVVAGRDHRLGERDARVVAQRSARSAGIAPVSIRDPRQATPKRAPSSSEKATTATGRSGRHPDACSRSMAANARRDAERTVPVAAARHAVEVRPDHQRRAGQRGVPPRPQVAVAVGLDVEARARPARPANHSRRASSGAVQASRVTPPAGSRPMSWSSERSTVSRLRASARARRATRRPRRRSRSRRPRAGSRPCPGRC